MNAKQAQTIKDVVRAVYGPCVALAWVDLVRQAVKEGRVHHVSITGRQIGIAPKRRVSVR